MRECTYVFICLLMYVCMRVCMYVCVFECVCARVCVYVGISKTFLTNQFPDVFKPNEVNSISTRP